MGQITLAVTVNERVYRTLERRATAQHQTISDLTSDLVSEVVAQWSEPQAKTKPIAQSQTGEDEVERIRALPLAERRELARRACTRLRMRMMRWAIAPCRRAPSLAHKSLRRCMTMRMLKHRFAVV